MYVTFDNRSDGMCLFLLADFIWDSFPVKLRKMNYISKMKYPVNYVLLKCFCNSTSSLFAMGLIVNSLLMDIKSM